MLFICTLCLPISDGEHGCVRACACVCVRACACLHVHTVVPAFNGHFCIQAKVSLHGRCPLIGGTGMLEWRAEIRRVRCSHVCHQGATNQQ